MMVIDRSPLLYLSLACIYIYGTLIACSDVENTREAENTFSNSTNSSSSEEIPIKFNPPDLTEWGLTQTRSGGGAGDRGGLGSEQLFDELVALSPQSNIGLTIDEHPSLFFHIPFSQDSFVTLQFAIADSRGEKLHFIEIDAPDSVPGIAQFTIPQTQPGLEQGEYYLWFFSILFEESNNALDTSVNRIDLHGWIIRANLDSNLEAELLAVNDDRNKAAILAEQGVWYSALSLLANLYLSESASERPLNDWRSILGDQGLEEISTRPIIDCCLRSSSTE